MNVDCATKRCRTTSELCMTFQQRLDLKQGRNKQGFQEQKSLLITIVSRILTTNSTVEGGKCN